MNLTTPLCLFLLNFKDALEAQKLFAKKEETHDQSIVIKKATLSTTVTESDGKKGTSTCR